MGITQQRLIDQNNAAHDYEQALLELMSRIRLMLSRDPHNPYLQSLAAITPNDLLQRPNLTPIAVARESENIRLTRRFNERRRLRGQAPLPPPTVPDLEDPIETRWLLQQAKLAEVATPPSPEEKTKETKE